MSDATISSTPVSGGTRIRPLRERNSSDRSETGSSLILALIFIVVVSILVGAVSSMAMNDLNNTTQFNSATTLDYTATSVANLAIQSVRYTPTPTGVLSECWNAGGTTELALPPHNDITVAIWCDSVSHSGSSQSRVVTMYACENNPGQNATASSCQANPLLTLVEAYDDYSVSGTDTCTTAPSATSCGFGASTLVWTWGTLANATGGQILNTINVTSSIPSPAYVGNTYQPSATTSSGDPVTITSASTAICTVSGGIVTFIAAGLCTVDFDDPGNFNYAPAQEQSQQIPVTVGP